MVNKKQIIDYIKDKDNDIDMDWRNGHLICWIPFFAAEEFVKMLPYAGLFDEGQIQDHSGVYDNGIILTHFEEVLDYLDIIPETICKKENH